MKEKIVLFDGTDLNGFYVVGTDGDLPDWKIEDGWFRMHVTAPRGLNQEVVLPNGAVMHTDLDRAVYTCRL